MKLLSLVTTVILSTSCGSKSSSNNSAQEIDVEQTDENGMVRGKFLGGTDQLQRLTVGSGNLAGTEITFPAGSLNIDLELSISESSDQLASDDFLTAAGVDGELSNLGPSVNLNASGNVTLDQPFTLRLPTGNSNSLRLAGQNPLVFAKLKKGDSEEIFIFPSSAIVVEEGFAKFESKFFGIFQFAYSTVAVETEKAIQDISTEIKVKGQKIDPITGWEDQQYSAFGITFDKEGLLTGYFKTENGPFDYVVPELTNLKLVKDTGRRFFKLAGLSDDESTFIFYSSKTDALAMIEIAKGKFDLSLLQTSSFSYPPVTSSERTTDEYVGKYYGDSFQFEAADGNWSADKAKLKSITRDVIEMTKVD